MPVLLWMMSCDVAGTQFENFGSVCAGTEYADRDYAIVAPPYNDDMIHPTELTECVAKNTDQDSLLYIPLPRLEWVNPHLILDWSIFMNYCNIH